MERSDVRCLLCEQERGYIYAGPVYAEGNYTGRICPWCIADGRAHTRLHASFTDTEGVGGYGKWDDVSDAIIEAVAYRTPGFDAWQQERWFTHCNDAAAFLGPAGYKELRKLGRDAITAIRDTADMGDDEGWPEFYHAGSLAA